MNNPQSSPAFVRFENVSKKYGNTSALMDISFEIQEGEIVGFLGPNGAGKTTAMRILSGFFPPTSGRVWIKGLDLFKRPQKAKRFLGYLPESVNLYPDMRVFEFLKLAAQLKGIPSRTIKAHLQGKMALCGLVDMGRRLIGRLSKGYRQRVGIAQALIGDPPVLILDEPTTGLDPEQIAEIRALIRILGRDRAVILSTHILPEVSMVCSRVIMIERGHVIASGTVKELSSCLKARDGILVTVKDTKYRDASIRVLQSVPGVENLRVSENAEGEIHLEFETTQEEDLRPRISELFVKNQIPLAEIQRVKLTLEDIFLRILRKGRSAEGAL